MGLAIVWIGLFGGAAGATWNIYKLVRDMRSGDAQAAWYGELRDRDEEPVIYWTIMLGRSFAVAVAITVFVIGLTKL